MPIYCDDRILRVILKNDHNLRSFSTQTLIAEAQENKIITAEKKYELERKMIDLNYEFISIDASFIYAQLEAVGFSTEKIQKIISTLSKKETDIKSIEIVLADLFLLFMINRTISQREKIDALKDVIRQIGSNHDLATLQEGVLVNLMPRANPGKEGELRRVISLIFGN